MKPIPDGWTRDNNFNSRFLQGGNAGYTGPVNGGGLHTHSETATHTHTGNAHCHDIDGPAATGGSINIHVPTQPTVTSAAAMIHAHQSVSSASAVITYGSASIGTVQSQGATPPCVSTIVIQPDDMNRELPADAVCFGDSADVPIGFSRTDGEDGTIDLDGRFLIGAKTGHGGGVAGGAATHTHTVPIAHTHSVATHAHSAIACGVASANHNNLVGLLSLVRGSIHHNVSLNPRLLSGNLSSDAAVVAEADSEPAHIKLLGLQNTSGRPMTSGGVIVPFIGAPAEIPRDWKLCDGTNGTLDCFDLQVKVTTTDDEIGETGGSDSHTHGESHGHTHTSSHYHLATQTESWTTGTGGATAVCGGVSDAHTHPWVVSYEIPTLQNASVVLTSTDKRSYYRKVLFIKYVAPQSPPPVAPKTPRDEFIPGWFSETRPPEPYEPDTRGWSTDRCGRVYWAACVSRDNPKGRPLLRPITAHPVRAMSLLGDAGRHNQELCRHHYGRYCVNQRGRTEIVYCHQPDIGAEYRKGTAKFFVCPEGSDFIRPGRIGAVGSMQLPSWRDGFFNSYGVECGEVA